MFVRVEFDYPRSTANLDPSSALQAALTLQRCVVMTSDPTDDGLPYAGWARRPRAC